MDALTTADALLFEDFRLDRGGLSRCDQSGTFVPLPIGSRALEILAVLVARPGELVTRDEIIKEVWPGTIVEYSNLPVQIAALRRILDRDRQKGSCIQNVAGRGYRFVAPVTSAEAVTAASISRSTNGAGGPIAADEEPELLSALYPSDGLSPAPKPGTPPRRRRAAIASIAAGAMCLAFIVVAAMNWHSLSRWADGSAPRLSIVVLPFANLSNDPDQQYFTDALTEDLTIDMSRIEDMFVISSNTAFTLRGRPADTREIGRELGVRYVLEGSVQHSADRVRVNVQLINAGTDAHLWGEQFDHDISDLFTLQDEITARIASALNRKLIDAEAARPIEHADALDYILRGRAALNRAPSRAAYNEAIALFERALAVAPSSVAAKSRLADTLAIGVLQNNSSSPLADVKRAEGLVEEALAASPNNLPAHFAKANLLRAQNRYSEAIPEYETVIALNRNFAFAIASLGWCKFMTGSIEEAIKAQERAIRLDPRNPNATVYWRIGAAHLLQSHIDEAIDWLEKARRVNPSAHLPHAFLASAYALKGQSEHAAAELAETRRLDSDGRYASIARLKATRFFGVPKIRDLYEATYFAGLRKAGMPEE